MRARVPAVDLDLAGMRVERTPEGLLAHADPHAQRRAARKAGVVAALVFSLFALVPVTFVRVVALLLAFGALVLGFRAKPRDDRVLVAPEGVRVDSRRAPRFVPAADVRLVALERVVEEHGHGKDRRTVVRWPVRLELASGERWLLAQSGDAAKARPYAEDTAVALGVPFVDASGAAPRAVPASAVNLSLPERLRGGFVEAPDPGPPPEGVHVRVLEHGQEVAAAKRAWPVFAGLLFMGTWFAALGGFGTFALVAVATSTSPWAALFALFPALFALAGLGMIVGAVAAVTGESFLRVRDGAVEAGVRRFGRERVQVRGEASAYEDVRVLDGVQLVGDGKEAPLGFGQLPQEKQRWVAAWLLRRLA